MNSISMQSMGKSNTDSIGQRIEQALTAKGLTQEAFGKMLVPSVTGESVNHWVKGKNNPKSSRISQIADILNVSKTYLITGEDNLVENTSNRNRSPSEILVDIDAFQRAKALADDWFAGEKSQPTAEEYNKVLRIHYEDFTKAK